MTTASDSSAFPETWGQFTDTGGQIGSEGGLTKREHFAGLAMQGLIVAHHYSNPSADDPDIAEWAVGMADALIAALNEQPPSPHSD